MNKILIEYTAGKETAATVFGAYFKLNSFVFMPVFGLNNGVIPILAYNYGAQNRRRMTKTIRVSLCYASAFMLLGTVCLLYTSEIYTRFNLDRPEDFKGWSLSVGDIILLHQRDGSHA